MKKILKIGAVSALAAIIMSSAAMAGTTFKYYDLVIGRLNGSGYTEYQKKTTTGAAGRVKSGGVGQNYVVDVRMQHDSAHGEWVRDLTDNDTRSVPATNQLVSGQKVQLKFSNDWNTPVAVNAWGDWKSN